jgi:hypothetical protein
MNKVVQTEPKRALILVALTVIVTAGCGGRFVGRRIDVASTLNLRPDGQVPATNRLASEIEARMARPLTPALVREAQELVVNAIYPGEYHTSKYHTSKGERLSGRLAFLGADKRYRRAGTPDDIGALADAVCQHLGWDRAVWWQAGPPGEKEEKLERWGNGGAVGGPDAETCFSSLPESLGLTFETLYDERINLWSASLLGDSGTSRYDRHGRSRLALAPSVNGSAKQAGSWMPGLWYNSDRIKPLTNFDGDPVEVITWSGKCSDRGDGLRECPAFEPSRVTELYRPQLTKHTFLSRVICTNTDSRSAALLVEASRRLISLEDEPEMRKLMVAYSQTSDRGYFDKLVEWLRKSPVGPFADEVKRFIIAVAPDESLLSLIVEPAFGLEALFLAERSLTTEVLNRVAKTIPPCKDWKCPLITRLFNNGFTDPFMTYTTDRDDFEEAQCVVERHRTGGCSNRNNVKYPSPTLSALRKASDYVFKEVRRAWIVKVQMPEAIRRGARDKLRNEFYDYRIRDHSDVMNDALEEILKVEGEFESQAAYPLKPSLATWKQLVLEEEREAAAVRRRESAERRAEEARQAEENAAAARASAAAAAEAKSRAAQKRASCVAKCLAKPNTDNATCNRVCAD